MREKNQLYIDKTAYIEKLLNDEDRLFFLQRPRRFGKSLFLSTMESLFQGDENLFDGLALNASNYEFIKYPILKFSFTNMKWRSDIDVELDIYKRVCVAAKTFGLSVEDKLESSSNSLNELVMQLKKRTDTRIVILVDEYDSPILSALEDPKKAMANATVLGGFFNTIKDLNQNEYIRLAFVTGVSKFSMTSIFSGANIFTDISEKKEYANICGITLDEFDKYLRDPILEMFEEGSFGDKKFKSGVAFIKALKDMYDGYTWNSIDKIINPFSLLRSVKNRELKPYWFWSGTPTFLHKFVRSNPEESVNLERIEMNSDELERQSADEISLIPLLYQTGYLTQAHRVEDGVYTLKIPNKEVRNSFNILILKSFAGGKIKEISNLGSNLLQAFKENDEKAIQDRLTELISNLGFYENELYERTFNTIIKIFLILVGVNNYYSELKIKGGRIDICFMLDDKKAILLELKAFKHELGKRKSELEKKFASTLKQASEQLRKYYDPLFDEIKADEIQGIALALAWDLGVRAKLDKKVRRGRNRRRPSR
jgi:hypothetical protein